MAAPEEKRDTPPETGWSIVLKVGAFIAVPLAAVYIVKLLVE